MVNSIPLKLQLVRTKCVRTNVVRALTYVVATKLGIIVLLLLSFIHLLCGNGVRALWVSEHPPRRTHINIIRKSLSAGTVPVTKKHLTGTLPANKEHLRGTVPVNKEHLTGTLYIFWVNEGEKADRNILKPL